MIPDQVPDYVWRHFFHSKMVNRIGLVLKICLFGCTNVQTFLEVEIIFVLNADTGYVFNLSNDLYEEVIQRFRSLYPDAPFISGVTAVDASPDNFKASCYHPHLEIAAGT